MGVQVPPALPARLKASFLVLRGESTDFTEIIRDIKLVKSFSKPTHASALLLWFSKPSASTRKVLELGSGSGIVSIGIAKVYKREAVGLEILKELVEASRESARLNKVDEKVKFIRGDVRNIEEIFRAESFDMVISNPPHHTGKDSSPNLHRAISRTGESDTVRIFTKAIFWTLKNGGEYSLVLSPENLMDWLCALKGRKLEPKRMVFFHPKNRAELVAIRGRKNARTGLVVEKPLS